MLEVRRRVASRHHIHQQAHVLERVPLERAGIRHLVVDSERVPRLVEQRGSQVLDRAVALIERAHRVDALEHVGRDRLVRLEVACVVLHDLGPQHPHLVHLAGELDEVAEHVGARELRVRDMGEQTVQRVAELVEERLGLVEGQQRRLPGRRLRHVQVVHHDRRLIQQRALRAQRVHPCPAALGVSGVEIEQVQPER